MPNTNCARSNYATSRPKLPVTQHNRPVLVTSGPEPMSWKKFDEKIAPLGAKWKLTTFLIAQEVHGNFQREMPDPVYLSKLILKRARRLLVNRPITGSNAVKNAGHEILAFYVKPEWLGNACLEFNTVVNSLGLDRR